MKTASSGLLSVGTCMCRGSSRRWCSRHPEISADHIDHGLPLSGVALRYAFQRVQTAEADRGILGAELVDRAGVEFCDTRLSL